MKKLFGILFLSLSCACTVAAAAACDEESGGTSGGKTSDNAYTVSFTAGEGFDYVLTGAHADKTATALEVTEDETVSFSLDVGAFYAGTPTVLANNVTVASADGVYTVTVKADTTITVNGISKDVSNMSGTGAYDDAFLVTRPIDLIYIAEQVNAGNETYSTAAYVLGNDIDCKGEELKVIGDLSTDNAFFSGCFVSYSDPDTGEMAERFTISNFTINATDTSYVGLFGCVQTNLTTTSSGLFYGIRLDNYSINASTSDMKEDDAQVIYCGSLIGYGIGVNVYLCDATNGEVNIYADSNYFAFTGGLIGCQQAYYEQSYNQVFTSEITYSTVDVDVTTLSGTTLYAGGIVGYAFTNSLVAPAYLHNCYSTGNVSGGLRAGGIVGGLGQYTSVATCYSTGDILAQANNVAGGLTTEEYCIAYAGGIVGYAENDSIVNDCFFTGDALALAATTGAGYTYYDDFVGGGDKAGTAAVNAQRYVLLNRPTIAVDTYTQADYEAIGFHASDWIFSNGELPLINYETSAETVETVYTVHYVTLDEGVTVKANGVTQTRFTLTNAYEPIVNAFNGGNLAVYLTAKATKANTIFNSSYLSYGYFFDEDCTIAVPYSFLTTRSVDLYVGFADYSKVSGTYYLQTEKGAVPFTLTRDGMCEYTDGTVDVNARFLYDGNTILIEGATFSQYYMGAVDSTLSVNEDADFDMNRYAYANVEGTIGQDGSLSLYDGVYFTKDSPLQATKTFSTLAPAPIPDVDFNAQWYSLSDGTLLVLDGEKATVEYADGMTYDLVVEQSMTDGYLCLYYVYQQTTGGIQFTYKTVFGYLKYDGDSHTLAATLLDTTGLMESGYNALTMLYVDSFEGEWVSADGTFGNMRFNGFGYPYGINGYQGYLTVGDDDTRIYYTLDENEVGTFYYDGYRYELRFDKTTGNAYVVSANGDALQMQRADEFAKYGDFVAFDEETFTYTAGYRFDGKSYLTQGGILTTPRGEKLKYKDGKIYPLSADLTQSPSAIGTIVKTQNKYYTLTLGTEYKLYPATDMMGIWAMSGEFDCLEIGPASLDGEIYAQFKGKTVKMSYIDPATLTFSTKIQNMPVTYYLFLLTQTTDGVSEVTGIAMSEYTSLAYNVYTICSKADDLYGVWTQADGRITMSFDGVSFDPSGRYSYGQAYLSYNGNPTPYYYIYLDNGEVLMWSQATISGKTRYYTLVDCQASDEGAYVLTRNGETRAVKRVEVDSLFQSKATDKNGYTYTFNGGNVNGNQGVVTVSKNGATSKTYWYKITEYKTNAIVLTLTDESGNTYAATIDTSDVSNPIITVE